MLSILIPAFILSFSACIDNIVVGVAYGMKKTKISFISNLIIALITSCGTLLSMMFGKLLTIVIPVSISSALGAAIIIIIGIYFILDYLIKQSISKQSQLNTIINELSDAEEYCNIKCRKNACCPLKISIKETIMLSFALTINNLGIGISASLAGVNIYATVILTFVLSLLTIIFGVAMGSNFIGRLFGRYASLASGILMIILGIIELF